MTSSPLLRALRRLFGHRTTARVFEPLLADWHADGRTRRTALPRLATSCQWAWALAHATASAAWHFGVRGDRGGASLRAALGPITVFSLVGSVILLLPFIRGWSRPGFGPLVVYGIPQAVGMALPFAMLPGAMTLGAAAPAGRQSRQRRRLVAIVAVVVVMATANLGWVMPPANQAWRVAINGNAVRPGIREVTLLELGRDAPVAGVTRAQAHSELRARLLVALAWPGALATLGWRIGRRRHSVGTGAMLFWWTIAVATMAVVDGWRHVARELPQALAPVLWLAVALLFREQADSRARTDLIGSGPTPTT